MICSEGLFVFDLLYGNDHSYFKVAYKFGACDYSVVRNLAMTLIPKNDGGRTV
jgi:hypothetical protein